MPMIVVGTEKNFAALRQRLFEGKVSTAVSRDVAEAIRVANPNVDLDRLEPGTVITVPDSPNVAVRGDLSLDDTTKGLLAGISEAAAAALGDLADAAQARDRDDAAERKALAASLGAKELTEATRVDKTIAADLKAATDALPAEDASAAARAESLKQAQDDWGKELAALKDLLG